MESDEWLKSKVREVIVSNWLSFGYTGADEWIIGFDVLANANVSFHKSGRSLRAAIRYDAISSKYFHKSFS